MQAFIADDWSKHISMLPPKKEHPSRLRDVPIRRKLIILTTLICVVAVTVSCLVFVCIDFYRQHRLMIADLDATAATVSTESAGAILNNSPFGAEQSLKWLEMRPHVIGAALYDSGGHVFATYHSSADDRFTAPVLQPAGYEVSRQAIHYFHEIRVGGKPVGTLYLLSDMVEGRARLDYYVMMLVLTWGIAALIAFLLASRWHRVISAPILHLAAVVKNVAADKNYDNKATRHGNDELGQLIDGFNDMLDQLQHHQRAVEQARDALELRVAERTRELAGSVALLNATIESTADGILALQVSGEVVCHNGQFLNMWGVDPEPFRPHAHLKQGLAALMSLLKDEEQCRKQIEEMRANVELEYFHILQLKDGRTFERYVKPQRVDGRVVGRVINFRDITSRRQAEEKIERIHRELLNASRQAGMAEVASSVLHNVGNVLNSVNVSCELIADTIKDSKVSALAKVSQMLEEHCADAATFLANDPKGKLLPSYLVQLCSHLLKEQSMAVNELELLRANIHHIKEIVSMQQSHSKASGVKEFVCPVDLMEDVLRMNHAALQRHGIEVVREYAEVPKLNTERHKILQILVNLVHNAKHACSASTRADKKVLVRVSSDPQLVKIAVIDNGVGISPENLVRIFSHGFTTRKDGHGYGLHSGALAAKELGGVLRVESDGVGEGARFTLELPIAS